MRSHRTARLRPPLVVALLAAGGCAGDPPPPPQTLGVAIPAAYQGVLPCPDCPGIRTTFVIRGDGTYLLEQIRDGESPNAGRTAEIGTWQGSIPERRIVLRGPDAGSPAWQVISMDTLVLLEQARRRARPSEMPLLVRLPIPETWAGPFLTEAEYSGGEGEERLMPCPGPVRYPVTSGPGAEALRAAVAEAGGGASRLVRVRGWLGGDSIRVEAVESVASAPGCPDALPADTLALEPGDPRWAAQLAAATVDLPSVQYELVRGDATSQVRARYRPAPGGGPVVPVLLEERMELGDYGESLVTWYFHEGGLVLVEERGIRRLVDPADPSRPVELRTRLRFGPDGTLRSASRTMDRQPTRIPQEELEGLRAHATLLLTALQATGVQGSRDGTGAADPDSSSSGER